MSIEVKESLRSSPLWSTRQIWIASFIAGPFGGLYLVGQNFKALGKTGQAKCSVRYGILATLILMSVCLFWEAPPGFFRWFLPFAYTTMIWEYAKRNQGTEIQELLASGVKRSSYWRLLGISLATLLSMFLVGCGLGIIQSLFGG